MFYLPLNVLLYVALGLQVAEFFYVNYFELLKYKRNFLYQHHG